MADDDASRQRAQPSASEPSREHGVDFGSLAAELQAHDYPTTTDELLDAYGDHELDLPSGTETLGEILGAQTSDQRFGSPEEVRQAIFNMVGVEAVGRRDYSDRAGARRDPTEEGGDESI